MNKTSPNTIVSKSTPPLGAFLVAWPLQPPGSGPAAPAGHGTRQTSLAVALLAAAILLAGYVFDSALVLWSAAPALLWLAATHPVRLLHLLVFTTPTFPVLRLQQELVTVNRISTKGAFLSCDDPILLALSVAWIVAQLRSPDAKRRWFPGALCWLMVVYPVVILANWGRLEGTQVVISGLLFLKWAEYAALPLIIPQLLGGRGAVEAARGLPRLMSVVLVVSALFAAYEFVESLRTGAYSYAASFPRASSFFGTLDPARFGGSEDPVNFGCYVMVATSIALAVMSAGRTGGWMSWFPVVCGIGALLLSGSRAPLVAAAVAFALVYRLGSSRVVVAAFGLLMLVIVSALVVPQVWTVNLSRFEAVGQGAEESSANNRLDLAAHSPVFEIDQYWPLGHGFSSYRFVADEHSSKITGSLSLSMYNFLFAVWYDAGAAGLAFWSLLFVQVRRRLSAIHARSPVAEVRSLAWGLRGALWGIAAAAMFCEVPYNWRVMGVFYLAFGICLAADRASQKAAAAGWGTPVFALQWRRA